MRVSQTLSLAAALLLSVPAVSAAPQSFTADYSVTYIGLPVARATFTSTFSENGAVAIRGSLRSAGMARLFSSTQGSTTARGHIGSNGVEPRAFEAEYLTGRNRQQVSLRFERGGVAETRHQPPMRPRRSDWVHVRDGHLASVLDPLTATLVRAASAEEVCRRSVSVFDGWLRADLELEPVATGPVRGHEGTGARCRGRFTPVAGYRANNRDMRYLRDRSEIEVTFAPLGDTGLFAPVHASIGTRVGTVHITASSIRAN